MSDATLSGPAWEDLAAELQVCPQGARGARGPGGPPVTHGRGLPQSTARAAAGLTQPGRRACKVPRPGERDATDPGRGTSGNAAQ
jgi:hypothetical protein